MKIEMSRKTSIRLVFLRWGQFSETQLVPKNFMKAAI